MTVNETTTTAARYSVNKVDTDPTTYEVRSIEAMCGPTDRIAARTLQLQLSAANRDRTVAFRLEEHK